MKNWSPMDRYIDDGFGNRWFKCDDDGCGLEVVRPGKAQCVCEDCPLTQEHAEGFTTVGGSN